MTTETKKKDSKAFPFPTDNPSGVPGTTEISEEVVASIAGHAATEVEGVVRLGEAGILRTLTGVGRSAAESKAEGVEVEAGQKEAIFDMDLTVEYGSSIPEIVRNVRSAVATEIKEQVGLVAKEINVRVVEIEYPEDIPSGRVE